MKHVVLAACLIVVGRKTAMSTTLNIGILNLMHDKVDTQKRFSHVLTQTDLPVAITYFYPVTHYRGRPVPKTVAQISQPLDLSLIPQFDGFIVTGAPLEKLPFTAVTYHQELAQLFDCLRAQQLEQLYVCWGAMAALNHFYGIEKQLLPRKLFGTYPQKILQAAPLLHGLQNGFLAPHARYAEMNAEQINANPALALTAVSTTDALFLVENHAAHQHFVFSHLEYGQQALQKEYQRELAAAPQQKATLAKPQHYFKNDAAMTDPVFAWQATQQHFFKNWLHIVMAKKVGGL